MFHIAIFIGVYSYLIFFLGQVGLLYTSTIVFVTLVYIVALLVIYNHHIRKVYTTWIPLLKQVVYSQKQTIPVLVIILLGLQTLVNFIGVLGPEYAYDALWYHLTLPKLYLLDHKIFFIFGEPLYYSVMPKLVEMLYVSALAIHNEILAKGIHFIFGLASLLGVYHVSRMFFTRTLSLLTVLVFSSNLVFAWESTTAYIDLGRTFYEVLALWSFLLWLKTSVSKWYYLTAIMVGFAITVKVLSLGSLFIFTCLIAYILWQKKVRLFDMVKRLVSFLFVCLIIPLPWFIFAMIHTGNPVFPFFSGYHMDPGSDIFSPIRFFQDSLKIFLFEDDPLSPIYIISFPLVCMLFKKFNQPLKLIGVYSFLAFLLWYITPRTGGGRFILPYLPAFSLLVVGVLDMVKREQLLYKGLITIILVIACITIIYRSAAVSKFIPVIIGKETKKDFLTRNLNFSFGDFYDIDNYFAQTITEKDTVLLVGFHNLYYVNFPFKHIAWIKKGERFNYVAIYDRKLPERFYSWEKIYTNEKTGVSLYTKDKQFVSY